MSQGQRKLKNQKQRTFEKHQPTVHGGTMEDPEDDYSRQEYTYSTTHELE